MGSVLRSSQSGVTPLSLTVVIETYVLLHSDSSRRHIRGIGLVVGCVTGCHNLSFVFSFGVSLSTYILGAHDMSGGEEKFIENLAGKPEGKKQLGRPRQRREDNIMCVQGQDLFGSEQGQVAGCCEHGSELLVT